MPKLVNIVALAIVLTTSFSACKKETPRAATLAVALASDKAYAVGDKARCPVTGEEFVVAASTVQVEHEGKHYAFCCADCQPAFTKNPAKYLAAK
jgi:YHS domain-containing protein